MRMDSFFYKFVRVSFLFSIVVSVFVFCFSIYFSVFFGRNALAQDPSTSSAFRAAETALNAFLLEVKDSSKKDKPISVLGSCLNGFVEGKNTSGRYKVEFFSDASVQLSCSEKISRVYFLRVTGSVNSKSWILASGIIKRGNPIFQCTGNLPDNAEVFLGDDLNLPSDLPWQYSMDDTSAILCQYKCQNGFLWNGSKCKSSGGSASPSLTYVTFGNENQTKEGSFGVNAAFSAFGGMDAGGKRIQEVASPGDDFDAVNKEYVDVLVKASFP